MADSRIVVRSGFVVLVLVAAPADAFVHIGQGVASKWGGAEVGTGAVVTWGFVPDGTIVGPDFNGVGVVGGSNLSQLRALIDGENGDGAFDAAIRRAFETWSTVADVEFVEVTDPGTPIAAPGSVTPNIRISAFLPDPDNFFAGTGAIGFGPPGFVVDPELDFPESGDILFNLNGNPFRGPGAPPFHIASGEEDATPVDFFNLGDDLEGLFLHEVGHAAIGLDHPPGEGLDPDRRVMFVGAGCCQSINRELSADDIAGARFVYGLKGDYNDDGRVDAADYTVWRDALGQSGDGLAADGNRNAAVDAEDYHAWRANFAAVEVTTQGFFPVAAVPEPSAALLVVVCGVPFVCREARRQPSRDR